MASTACANTPELLSLIISNLIPSEPPVSNLNPSEPSVAVYATVSKEWCSAIERHTFSTIHLTPFRLSEFARIVTGTRRGAVRRLDFDIVLDPYSTDVQGQFETLEEQERNNQVFTESMQTLFSHLSTWRLEDSVQRGIKLSLKAYSPSDLCRMEQRARMHRLQRARHRIGGRDLLDRRFTSSFLRLVPYDTDNSGQEILPVIPIITELIIEGFGYTEARSLRNFWPASVSLVASKLPRLYEMDLTLQDYEKKDLALRKRARNDFSKSFTTLPSSVNVFNLTYRYDPPSDQTFPPNITISGSDLFSISVRRFSQQLTSLTLLGMVFSSEFFLRPKSDLKAQNVPYWPSLTTLKIFYSPVTPSGEWLFERDLVTEVNDDFIEDQDLTNSMDEDELPPREYWKNITFRKTPNKELINNLYLAAGHAVIDMPRIKEMTLGVSRHRPMPIHRLRLTVVDSKVDLALYSTPRFKPEQTVLDVWKWAVRKNTGSELVVSYFTQDGSEGRRKKG